MTTVKIDWMKAFANSPRIILEGIKVPDYPSETDPIWQKTKYGLHAARKGNFVFYFYSNGKPTEGYGGRRFAGTLEDGTHFEYKGAWSSRAGCINRAVLDSELDCGLIVDIIVGSRPCAVTSAFLRTLELPDYVEWTCRDWDTEPVLEPTYLGKMKGDEGFVFPE